MIVLRTALAGGLLAALTTVLVCTVRQDGYYADPGGLSWWYAASWALFAAAVLALRKVPPRHAVVLVLAGSALVAATGLVAQARTSTDAYRYAWDGRVQAAGISPYDHAPADRALAPLRDDWLFPTGAACRGPARAPVPAPPAATRPDRETAPGTLHCTRLNRPTVHTIYPPVAEVYFLGVHVLSPDGTRLKPLQIGGALVSVAITGALLLILRRRGDPRNAAYWAWCPAVPIEAVNNAHVDVLGVLFAVLGLGLVARRRVAGGALIGAAIAVKLMPAIVLPGALSGVRRVRDAAAILVPAAAVTVLAYVPYILLSDGSVFGYLGGYVEEEGYDDADAGNRYALLRLVLPPSWALPALVAAMLVVCAYVVRRGDPERPWSGALLVTGTAFLLLTPGYSWYALLLIALVALDGRWEWLLVAVAGAAKYVSSKAFSDSYAVGTTVYAVAGAAVLIGALVRHRSRRSGAGGGGGESGRDYIQASGPGSPPSAPTASRST
ncbi:glycosyltransferase family 87 protein [Streptomyces sp. P9(2023)]|uniref:glycosyltransferase family 87 protein n=1 Tax=Streptomyces sp. P9(2023) TaxID=3064394 RepID=UPI0028F451F1|nr:glycosyltransferase family 87 protein [Streptomyces sp. P9(2023)]MDT9688968.1 glycosyltransferase family 87 protein [Streptomyces sp. P9(2023)]